MALITAAAVAIALTSSPPSLVLGRDAGADFEVRAAATATVTITSSVGIVGEVRHESGVFRAHFTPPGLNAPTVALVLATIDDGGARKLSWLAVPMSGSDTLRLETRPGARLEADIGGKTFGPVTADKKGSVSLPVIVPPGVREATLHITDRLGNASDRPLDLEPPPFSRIRIAPRATTATSASPLEVEIFVVLSDGLPDRHVPVQLIADRGETSDTEPVAPGIYLAKYLAPAGASTGSVVLEGKASAQLARTEVPLSAPRVILLQPPWRSSLMSERPWTHALGVVGGGGATFDGAAAGTWMAEYALRLEYLPVEAIAQLGLSLFSPVSQGNGERAHARSFLLNLGARLGYQLVKGFDTFAQLSFGVEDQFVKTRLPSGQVLDLDAAGPRAALAFGASWHAGAGRLMLEVQFDSTPGGLARLIGSLGAMQVLGGYLVTLP